MRNLFILSVLTMSLNAYSAEVIDIKNIQTIETIDREIIKPEDIKKEYMLNLALKNEKLLIKNPDLILNIEFQDGSILRYLRPTGFLFNIRLFSKGVTFYIEGAP